MTDETALPPVSILRLFLKMGGWFVIGLGATLLMLALVGQMFFALAQRFDVEGRQAVAIVTEKYITESTDSDGDRTITHWLMLDYATEAGEDISTTQSVSSDEYTQAKKGGEIELWYLQSQPERIEITRGSNARGARVVRIILLILGAAWLGFFWVVGRWVVEAVRTRRYGAVEQAEVTEVAPTSVRINNRPRYRLKWRDAQGRVGQSLMRRAEDLETYPCGAKIRIYQGLKRAWWAGDIGDPVEPPR